MASALNKSRILVSKVLGVGVLLCVFFTYSVIKPEGTLHEVLDFLGMAMVSICALGRLYTTAYLGGSKNVRLITNGPFSIVRNPLYVFSLIGFTGVALMVNHIAVIVIVPLAFVLLYQRLIAREEKFLKEQFGQSYEAYCNSVPRLLPNFSLWEDKKDITVNTRLLLNGAKDAIWWFAAFPLVEFIEFIQDQGLIIPHILVP